jgi:hypothetical protein
MKPIVLGRKTNREGMGDFPIYCCEEFQARWNRLQKLSEAVDVINGHSNVSAFKIIGSGLPPIAFCAICGNKLK